MSPLCASTLLVRKLCPSPAGSSFWSRPAPSGTFLARARLSAFLSPRRWVCDLHSEALRFYDSSVVRFPPGFAPATLLFGALLIFEASFLESRVSTAVSRFARDQENMIYSEDEPGAEDFCPSSRQPRVCAGQGRRSARKRIARDSAPEFRWTTSAPFICGSKCAAHAS